MYSIEILKLVSGEEIIGFVVPEANNSVKYNELVGNNKHSGIFERSNAVKGTTVAFACVLTEGAYVSRWISGEVSWRDLLSDKKEIPYVFIRDDALMFKITGDRISNFTLIRYKNLIAALSVWDLLDEHFEDHQFGTEEDSGDFDSTGQAVS